MKLDFTDGSPPLLLPFGVGCPFFFFSKKFGSLKNYTTFVADIGHKMRDRPIFKKNKTQKKTNIMQNSLITKKTNECCSSYNRSTKGVEIVGTCDNLAEFKEKVERIEANYIFDNPDGTISDESGNEVFDPKSPNSFDFGDYNYYIEEIEKLDSYNDAHIFRALKEYNESLFTEIIERLGISSDEF